MPQTGQLSPPELLDELHAQQQISTRRGAIYDRQPRDIDLPELRAQHRIEGLLLGVAVGDALGHSTEWQYDPERRHREHGTILDHVGSFYSRSGRISDDTQLTFWTVERLLARGGFDFHELAACFVDRRRQIVGIGKNVSAALARHADRLRSGSPALHACAGDPRTEGRGNGALMRFAPLVLPHLRTPSPRLWTDATLAALLTHGNPAAISGAVAFSHLLWEILRRPHGDAPEPEWWLDEYVRVARELEPGPLSPPPDEHPLPELYRDFRGSLWEFVDGPLRRAWQRGVSVRDACSLSGFGSRSDCAQTVPAALYILMHHADSFEAAIVAAVNDTKDNDTIAAIVGAFVGALHGRARIRRRWLDGIASRCLSVPPEPEQDDRGVIERLACEAAARFA
jgi:ADP-ribosylglycohydrolase